MSYFKIILSSVLIVLLLSGCAWLKQVKTDPVSKADQAIAAANTVVSIAEVTYTAILPNLPADKQAEVTAKWTAAKTALLQAETAVRFVAQAAADAKNDNPDFSTVFGQLGSAVNQIRELIVTIKGLTSSAGVGVAGVDNPNSDLNQAVGIFNRTIK